VKGPPERDLWIWRVFFRDSGVPGEHVSEADPGTGEFPVLPFEVSEAVEAGKMVLEESSPARRVYRAVLGHVDTVAPSAADAVRMASGSPEWSGLSLVSVSQVVDLPASGTWTNVPGLVRAGYNSCVPAAGSWLVSSDAKTLCAVASWNFASESSGVFRDVGPGPSWGRDVERTPVWELDPLVAPSVPQIRRLTGLSADVESFSLGRLERQGLVECDRSPGGERTTCRFSGVPVGRSRSPATEGMLQVADVVFPPGRPRSLSSVQRDVLGHLLDAGVPEERIASRLGVSRRTLWELAGFWE